MRWKVGEGEENTDIGAAVCAFTTKHVLAPMASFPLNSPYE